MAAAALIWLGEKQGWALVLAGCNVLLVASLWLWVRRVGAKVQALELKYHGLLDRLRYAVDKASSAEQHVRRATGDFSPVPKGDVDDTHPRGVPR